MLTIKQARLMKGYTQEEIASIIGVTPSTYIRYENNHNIMRMDTAYKFAKAVDKNINEIFFTPQLQNNRS